MALREDYELWCEENPCPACGGDGGYPASPCSFCSGTGVDPDAVYDGPQPY